MQKKSRRQVNRPPGDFYEIEIILLINQAFSEILRFYSYEFNAHIYT